MAMTNAFLDGFLRACALATSVTIGSRQALRARTEIISRTLLAGRHKELSTDGRASAFCHAPTRLTN
eukprot:6214705-Pleurochrysis_carterae.AAC.1